MTIDDYWVLSLSMYLIFDKKQEVTEIKKELDDNYQTDQKRPRKSGSVIKGHQEADDTAQGLSSIVINLFEGFPSNPEGLEEF